MIRLVKSILKPLVPISIRIRVRKILLSPFGFLSKNLSNKEVFEGIYRDKQWGSNPDGTRAYFSGTGSHDPEIVNTYVGAVNAFLDTFSQPQILVDLGCGDFNVGSRIAPRAKKYIACDLVSGVIEDNRRTFSLENAEFRVLDPVSEDLPDGEVIFVRQVLQHLSNGDIRKFCAKVSKHCSHLVLTEHLPSVPEFIPNIDKSNNCRIRLEFGSGVVLSEKPFNLKYRDKRVLCEVPEYGGIIRTTLY